MPSHQLLLIYPPFPVRNPALGHGIMPSLNSHLNGIAGIEIENRILGWLIDPALTPILGPDKGIPTTASLCGRSADFNTIYAPLCNEAAPKNGIIVLVCRSLL